MSDRPLRRSHAVTFGSSVINARAAAEMKRSDRIILKGEDGGLRAEKNTTRKWQRVTRHSQQRLLLLLEIVGIPSGCAAS